MDRREWLGVFGVAATAVVASGGTSRGADEKDDAHEHCAEECSDCSKECNQGFHHCYSMVKAGKPEYLKAMHLTVDCGEICATSAKLVARMSPLMVHTCHACAECCEATLAECEKLNDSGMKETVEALRSCSKSCREMVKSMGGHH